jgi:hypothetical protein
MKVLATNSKQTLQQYPCEYLFKAFGVAEPAGEFAGRVHAAIDTIVSIELEALQCRRSSKGGYLCVTVLVNLATEDQRQQIYRNLQTLEGLKYLL